MSIPQFITRICKQDAVYWGNPVNDGMGGYTFDDPIEIKCRWADRTILGYDKRTTDMGAIILSQTGVLVLQDLDNEGYLYLGTLEQLYDLYDSAESSAGGLNPLEIEKAYKIKEFTKVPLLGSTTEFVRRAFLYNQ
jgi:hypothetical protein